MHKIDNVNYMTTAEVADRLGVHPGTVRQWRSDGRSPVAWVKLAGVALCDERDVERLLRKRASA